MAQVLRIGVLVLALILSAGAAQAEPPYPPALVAEVAKYPQSTVVMVQKTAEANHAMLQAADKPEKIADYYRAALIARGWEIAQETATAEAQFLVATKGESSFTVSAVASDPGTTAVSLILGR